MLDTSRTHFALFHLYIYSTQQIIFYIVPTTLFAIPHGCNTTHLTLNLNLGSVNNPPNTKTGKINEVAVHFICKLKNLTTRVTLRINNEKIE